jgi:hypothetical protein
MGGQPLTGDTIASIRAGAPTKADVARDLGAAGATDAEPLEGGLT